MRMKLTTWIACAVAVVAPLAAGAQEASDGGPKMVVPEKIIDLGQVAKGVVADVDFEIANEGSETLEIKAVRPTCGCTVADFDREIAPGQKGAVRAKLDTSDFSGPVSKSILVMTNDPETPTVSLVIRGQVKPYVEVLPRALVRFNAIQHQDAAEKVLLVGAADVDEFKITSIEPSEDYLVTSVRPLEKDERIADRSDSQYELTLSLADDAPVGPVNGQVVVHTDNPKAKAIPIRVFGVVRSLLHVTPPSLQFGAVEAAVKPGRNLVVVSNRPDADVEITGAEVDDPAFEVAVYPIQEGHRYQVTVTLSADASAGNHEGTVTLKTTDPEYPEVMVPVRATVK
jgi:hypothetical protein